MALSKDSVSIPGKGTILLAPVDTPPPNYKTIDPAAPTGAWTALGHTSRDNAFKLTKDGGDATTLGSWWEEALVVQREGITWGLEAYSLQIDKDTLDIAFGGGELDSAGGYLVPSAVQAVDRAAFLLAIDHRGRRMGLWLPSVSLTLGDAPEFDPTKFLEVPLSGSLLSSPTKKTSSGAAVIMQWFHPQLDPVTAP